MRRTPASHLKTATKRRHVWERRALQTVGALKRRDLKENRRGKIVSRKRSAFAKKHAEPLKRWRKSVAEASALLQVPVQIKVKKTPVYRLAKQIYAKKTGESRKSRRSQGRARKSRRSQGRARNSRSQGRARNSRRNRSWRSNNMPMNMRVFTRIPTPYPRRAIQDSIDCSICLGTCASKSRKYCLCGHSFHAQCLNQWLLHNDTCPNCRQQCE